MRALVTGGAGFLGGHLARELQIRGWEVVTVDRADGDLRDDDVARQLVVLHKPDVVCHFAAKVGRLFGEDDPAETIRDNAIMTTNVARACAAGDVRLAYASTSEVYGDRGERTCVEDDHLDVLPHNIYGLSKRWGEETCQLYAPNGLIVWRISMPYGPGLPAGRGRAAIINMLAQADSFEPIPVHRGAERSWCWVGDTVRAFRLTLESPLAATWNVGRDDARVTMRDVAEMACDLTGAPPELIHEIDPPERQTIVKRLSSEKLRTWTGWHPNVSLDVGMRRCLSWLRDGQGIAA